ncbi:uncharacterized protein YfdQ (DUF2303 family) [Actinocorallia herbida]|uniref:Uncharacterized protein YfdQ (DUF2303 family) n=1 Tax=Actinocorallia herbida TaxID=58109 RepID=A0A3N1CMX3_9ACTN|nr:DUF2303 family protein [Actinocorallia herbida]ROO82643.1 uncharacterized protein YfdQ (DUF2303 family) [Actinocorallia herbida]
MSYPDYDRRPDANGTKVIVDTATRAAGIVALETGKYHAWASTDGTIKTLDLTGDQFREFPAAKTGSTTVLDLPSFVHYWQRHHDDDSELFLNTDKLTITAVLDAHMGYEPVNEGARWGRHRLTLKAMHTPEFLGWIGLNRQGMGQRTFAEHIEDHLKTILEPDAATMLEIAETFQASTKVKFSSRTRLSNGDRRLEWEETTDARAGEGGKLTVPSTFTLGLKPFEWSEPYKVTARLRYLITGGELRITYLLDDPARIVEAAMRKLAADLQEAINPGWTQPSEEHPDGSGDLKFRVMHGAFSS